MTKWEDTVLRDKEINVALKDYPHYFYNSRGRRYEGYWAVLKIALKAQAEISFKVGYKQAREEMDIQSTSLADLCLEHREGGIQEVVGWSNEPCIMHGDSDARIRQGRPLRQGNCYECWQAKCKEWGI